jgi:hypothetical protein
MAKAERICSVPDCGNKHRSSGYCRKHYARLRLHGDPIAGRTEVNAPARWIAEHAGYEGQDCLTWPFEIQKTTGYGTIWHQRRKRVASRVMCEVAHGLPPTPEHEAAHSCGRGQFGCMNPKHLRWATHAENQADKIGHGTSNRGEKAAGSVLTEQDVREIRALQGIVSPEDLSWRYGVLPATIYHVLNRETWKWVV